jgi:two-component system, sensor histidine kinase and response regulator
VSMPGMDGYDVCEKLKSDPHTADIPVIFLTAKVDQQDIITGFEKGAVDYVTKPFNATELIQRVFTHLELKYNRDLISRQKDELSKLNQVKNQLFSVISHDMKNLFNNILFGTETMEKEIEYFEKKDIIQMASVINDSAKRAYSLLQNLLDWSKSQMESINFRPGHHDIMILVNQALALFKPTAKNKEIIFDVEPAGEDFRAYFDIEMVKAVLRNLVSNAIKYSHPGGTIKIKVSEEEHNIKVVVQDFGIGMKEDQIVNLKTINHPLNSTPGTRNEKGSGLGMVLIRDFVLKNEGLMGFESTYGKGSVFWFCLPRRPKEVMDHSQ